MKRQILWAATAGIALAGCTHVECPGTENAKTPETTQSEITVNPFGRKMSRGIVTGAELKEREFADLHGVGDPKSRTFYMSAYNATEGTDYFIGKTFGEKTSTGIWGAVTPTGDEENPWQPEPIYWPFGAKLDFLAYSQSYDEAASSNPCPKIYANWKSANEVELEVTKESRQDDILYAATSGLNSSNSNSTIGFSMIFNHAQAWLTFKLKLTAASAGELTINSIKCAEIYSGGRLTLRNEGNGNASADWHFFPLVQSDVTVDDQGLLGEGHPLSTTATELNILLPPQDHKGFIINYTLGGRTCNLEIPVSQLMNASDNTWKAGWHYTYTFSFTLNEITVAPFITAWVNETNEWEEDNKYVKKLRGIETWLPDAYDGSYDDEEEDYLDLFADPTDNDNAHLTIPTQTSKYPTPTEYIALLNKILEGLQSGSVAPAGVQVSDITYKGVTYNSYGNYWHISTETDNEAHSLGKKIYDDMMESGLYTAILTLDGVQTIEIHLSSINLYYAKLQNAMNQTKADKAAASSGTYWDKLEGITYDATDNKYTFTFDSSASDDNIDEDSYKVLTTFFAYLADDAISPANLKVATVHDDATFEWHEETQIFGTGGITETNLNCVVKLWKIIRDSGTPKQLKLDGDNYNFKISLQKEAATP